MTVRTSPATFISVPRVNAAPAGYAISAGAKAALAKTFRLEYDLYHFLKQRLLAQVTEVCTPFGYFIQGDPSAQ